MRHAPSATKYKNLMKYDAVVIGASAGGMQALTAILPLLPADYPLPVVVVQHISPQSDNYMVRYFANLCPMKVKEADEKEPLQPGTIYFAPPNYHLLIEQSRTFSLSTEGRVKFSRPSIDVLFESAADAYCSRLIGIILTGANDDGSRGLQRIKLCGGLTIVQTPGSAEASAMPQAAISLARPDLILPLQGIAEKLVELL
jgi:two-component system chemotaxis response regulator CheB